MILEELVQRLNGFRLVRLLDGCEIGEQLFVGGERNRGISKTRQRQAGHQHQQHRNRESPAQWSEISGSVIEPVVNTAALRGQEIAGNFRWRENALAREAQAV